MVPQGIILNENDLRRAVSYFMTKQAYAYDVETSFDNRLVCHLNTVSWISLATEGCAIVIPMLHPLGKKTGTTTVATEYKSGKKAGTFYNKTIDVFDQPPAQLTPDVVFGILKPLFASSKIKIGHNLLFDLCSVAKYLGFVPPPPYHCSLVADWLLDENKFEHGLKRIIEITYGVKYDEGDFGKNVEIHPFEEIAYYAYSDAKWTYLLYKRQLGQLSDDDLNSVFKLEMNVLNTLIGMKLHGTPVDVPALEALKVKLTDLLVKAETEIYQAAGHKFNLNSPAQKQVVLYQEQKLKPWKRTTAGDAAFKRGETLLIKHWSTDDKALETYPNNAVACSLRSYSKINKMLSSFVNTWLGTDEKPSQIFGGYIHASFKQNGTKTGRFSCFAPNLQQIPGTKTPLGRAVKNIFIPEPGHKLIVADYSQMELVILAHYLREGTLHHALVTGGDVHKIAAAAIYGKTIEDVSKLERNLGKTVNFAVLFGAGPGRISILTGKTFEESKFILSQHEKTFPEIYEFRNDVLGIARERKPVPYLTTLLGRKRRLPDLNSRDIRIRSRAERQIFNSPIQGSLGDLIKLAMVRLDVSMPEDGHILVTVHDELLISYPEDRLEEGENLLRDAMTGPGIQKYLDLEMKIEMHSGDTWGSIKD
jgi:DNA polymerase I-like protein with 3'-5' exonuclease and polymerase domains